MKLFYGLLSCILGLMLYAAPTHASCVVETTGTYAEGTNLRDDKCDTGGNKKETLGTLLSGEDQTNNLLMTSGGVVRTTTFSSVTSVTSSAVTNAVPTGKKTFFAQMVNTTSETKALTLTIFGSPFNSTTYGKPVCFIEIPSTATTLELSDFCKSDSNHAYWFYTVSTYTSASAAPVTVYAQY